MNKTRRASIAKALEFLGSAHSLLTTAAEDERAAFDAMPEGLQSSDGGQKIEANANTLQDAADELQSKIDALGDLL